MKYNHETRNFFDDYGFRVGKANLNDDASAELARRVNGWEEVIGFIKDVANERHGIVASSVFYAQLAREVLRKVME